MPPKITDQEALIPSTTEKSNKVGVYAHAGLRIFSLITFFFLPNLNQIAQYALFGLVIIIQFWVTENIIGMQLIGLRWYIDFGSMKFSFYSKPDPFVPNAGDANSFWMIFIFNLLVWIIALAVQIFTSSWKIAVLNFIYIFAEGLNLFMFMKGHGMAKLQAEKNVLSAINTEPVPEFEMADSAANSTTDSDIDTDVIDSSNQSQNSVNEQNHEIDQFEENDEEEEKAFDPELSPKLE